MFCPIMSVGVITLFSSLAICSWLPNSNWHPPAKPAKPWSGVDPALWTPEIESILKFVHAYNDHSATEATKVLDPDFHRYSSTTGKVQDKAYYLVMWKTFNAAFPDEHWKVLNISQSGKNVTLQTVETGTFEKLWVMNNGAEIEPTGKNYTAPATTVFTLNDKCPPLIQKYHYSTVATGTGFLSIGLNGTAFEEIIANGY